MRNNYNYKKLHGYGKVYPLDIAKESPADVAKDMFCTNTAPDGYKLEGTVYGSGNKFFCSTLVPDWKTVSYNNVESDIPGQPFPGQQSAVQCCYSKK